MRSCHIVTLALGVLVCSLCAPNTYAEENLDWLFEDEQPWEGPHEVAPPPSPQPHRAGTIKKRRHLVQNVAETGYCSEDVCRTEPVCCDTPCPRPSTCCTLGTFTFQADYLYWRPYNDSFFIAIDNPSEYVTGQVEADEPIFFSSFDTKARTISPDFHGCSGFRLGLAYQPCNQPWQGAIKWTSICPSTSRTAKSKPGFFTLIPFTGLDFGRDVTLILQTTTASQSNPVPIGDLFELRGSEVKGKWDLDLHLVDVELGYDCCFAPCFHVRPHLDLRFAQIDQDLTIEMEGVIQRKDSREIQSLVISREKLKSEFCGVGPRLGADLRWVFCNGFGLYGELGSSLIYGENDTHDKLQAERNAEPTSTDFDLKFRQKRHSSDYCLRPMTDLALGLDWHCSFCCNQLLLAIKLGWEHHYFFKNSIVNHPAPNPDFNHDEDSALSLQGFTLSARLSF